MKHEAAGGEISRVFSTALRISASAHSRVLKSFRNRTLRVNHPFTNRSKGHWLCLGRPNSEKSSVLVSSGIICLLPITVAKRLYGGPSISRNTLMSKRAAKLAGVAPSTKNKLPPSPAKPKESASPSPSKRARAAASPTPQAKKGLKNASVVSDSSISGSAATGIAFEMVTEPPVDIAPLPPAHQAMLDRWLALETALVFFGRRGEPAVLGKLKLAVENSAGRSLHPRHLGQMLTLWPGCYLVRGHSALGRHRDFSVRASAQGGSQDTTMPPPPSKSLAHFDLSVELGPDEVSEAAAVATAGAATSAAAPAAAVTPLATPSSPAIDPEAPESSYAALLSRRRIAFSEARLLARRDKIIKLLREHAATNQVKGATTLQSSAPSASSGSSSSVSEPTGDSASTTSTAADAAMLANSGNLAAAASAFGALELNVPAAPLPGQHDVGGSASSSTSGSSSKAALPTARSQLGAPPATASSSVPALESSGGDAAATSTATAAAAAAAAAADQPTPVTSAATTQAALRARVAQREQSKAQVEHDAGGKAGRRKQRLLASLPSFCDALHSFLVQRRVATMPRAELVQHLTARLPWRPRPPPDQVYRGGFVGACRQQCVRRSDAVHSWIEIMDSSHLSRVSSLTVLALGR